MVKVKRPALQYFGGKWQLAPWIISHFPQHTTYVEPFAGGASVLLRKPPSPIEVYNDLDHSVVNFFRMLRDRPDELLKLIELTPYSYEEYIQAYNITNDELENARRFIIRCQQGFGTAAARNTGWSYSTTSRAGLNIPTWNNVPERLAIVAQRLKLVQIDNRPALETIERYDSQQTLFYVDPPYLLETRPKSTRGYNCEMHDGTEHTDLANTLKTIQGMAIISGYDSTLYNDLYDGWRRITKQFDSRHIVDGTTYVNGRTEVLWLSPNIQQIQLTLDLE